MSQWNLIRPLLPTHLKIIIHSQDGCKKIYNVLNKGDTNDKPLCENIWKPTLEKDYPELQDNWEIIYKVCHKTIQDNEFIWFQYRVLYKILGTKNYLKKVEISDSDECGLCNMESESIDHLFSKYN